MLNPNPNTVDVLELAAQSHCEAAEQAALKAARKARDEERKEVARRDGGV